MGVHSESHPLFPFPHNRVQDVGCIEPVLREMERKIDCVLITGRPERDNVRDGNFVPVFIFMDGDFEKPSAVRFLVDGVGCKCVQIEGRDIVQVFTRLSSVS